MKRRSFLRNTSLFTLPMVVGGGQVQALQNLFARQSVDNDRVLVIIYLAGGNDGLNTFIPLDQYSRLSNYRSSILIPESEVLEAAGQAGFHPSMSGFQELFKQDRLGVVQSVAYPDQDRSHFRSLDIWNGALDTEESFISGWLGEGLEAHYSPEGLIDLEHPMAISLDGSPSPTCQGLVSNHSIGVEDPEDLLVLPYGEFDALPDNAYGNQVSFLLDTIAQNNRYAETIRQRYLSIDNQSDRYTNGQLSRQLQIAARLIGSGMQTKIYLTKLSGFDTHAAQVRGQDVTTGEHADLLGELSQAIYAFQEDLDRMGVADRVVGMTYSEFGRKIVANGSRGTDHGEAAPMFFFGNCIDQRIVGHNPTIPDEVDTRIGVDMEHDFKGIYKEVIQDWLGFEPAVADRILPGNYDKLGLFGSCASTSSSNAVENDTDEIKVFPNPSVANAELSIRARSQGNHRVEVRDLNGRVVHLENHILQKGDNQVRLSPVVSPGVYVVRVTYGYRTWTTKWTVQ